MSARPAVLWIDDGHLDPMAWAFARQLARSRLPVLVLVTLRSDRLDDDLRGQLDALPDPDVIDVGPLQPLEHQELLRRLLLLDGGLVADIGSRTGFNPLFSHALLQDWVARGILERGSHGWVLAAGARPPLPDDVYDVWIARMRPFVLRYGPAAIERAAFLGSAFTSESWREVAELPPARLVELDRDLLDAGLLVSTPDQRRSFVHEMARQAAQRHARERGVEQEHHRACARVERSPEALGLHLLACGDDAAAVPLLARALRAAVAAGDGPSVLRIAHPLEAAIDAGSELRVEIWLGRVQALGSMGHLHEALELAERACALAEDAAGAGLRADAYRSCAGVLHRLGRWDRAIDLQERAVALARDVGDEARAIEGQLALAQMLVQTGQSTRGAELFRDAHARIGPAIPAKLATQAVVGLAYLAVREGDHEAGLRWAREARDAARAHGWLRMLATVTSFEAGSLHGLGRLREAFEVLGDGVTLLEQLGSPDVGVLRANQAETLLDLGEADRAAPVFEEALERLEEMDRRPFLTHTHALAARCAAERGDAEALDRHLGFVERTIGQARPSTTATLTALRARLADDRAATTRVDALLETLRTSQTEA